MIDEEAKTLDPKQIILGGFSQGAAIALYAGLTYGKELGGVVALSGYLPLSNEFPAAIKSKPRVLMCHGTSDWIVPYAYGQESAKVLTSWLGKDKAIAQELGGA